MAVLDSMGRRNIAADLTGLKVGRLEVVEFAGWRGRRRTWLCKCACGKQKTFTVYALRSKRATLSCGCLRRELVSTHHLSYSPEYQAWKAIKRRCLNPKTNTYRHYGGRGITVCDRWRDSFENFIADVGMRPSDDHSIERINNNGNYEPGNVKWATAEEQCNNKRVCRYVEFRGERLTVQQWSRRCGLGFHVLVNRIEKWGVEKALTTPPPESRYGQARGEASGHAKLTLENVLAIRQADASGISSSELAKQFNVTYGAIRAVVVRKNWKHVP